MKANSNRYDAWVAAFFMLLWAWLAVIMAPPQQEGTGGVVIGAYGFVYLPFIASGFISIFFWVLDYARRRRPFSLAMTLCCVGLTAWTLIRIAGG